MTTSSQLTDPLHVITLEMIFTQLVQRYGSAESAKQSKNVTRRLLRPAGNLRPSAGLATTKVGNPDFWKAVPLGE